MYRFLEQTVGDNMTGSVVTVGRELTMRELGKLFAEHDFNAFPVQENAHVAGIVSKSDYLACFVLTPSHIVPHYNELMGRTVAEVMSSEFIYVGRETKLTRVLQLMVDHRLRSIPVIDADRRLAGIISREDVMRALARCTSEGAATGDQPS